MLLNIFGLLVIRRYSIYLALALQSKGAQKRYLKKWSWLYANKTLFFKVRSGLDLVTHRKVLAFILCSVIFYFSFYWTFPLEYLIGTSISECSKWNLLLSNISVLCAFFFFTLGMGKIIYPQNQQSKNFSCDIYLSPLLYLHGVPLIELLYHCAIRKLLL